jgi:Holliday junction resolvase RusA-like endonuclease
MGKMIVDAMKGRIVEDDNRRWVRGVAHYFHDEDYISVEIREV